MLYIIFTQVTWIDQMSPNTQPLDNLILKAYETDTKFKPANRRKTESKRKINKDNFECDIIDVRSRLSQGCDCKVSCFRDLKAESVFKHRLNIAELSKSQHDMYLMGVTMASICDPTETSKHQERRRLRASYVYQGRRVCLDAFLYLENVTHYHLKRIRKHVMVNGVIPRVHGNIGKKPYNSFNLDTYQNVTNFIKDYIKKNVGVTGRSYKSLVIQGDTRKNMYDQYIENGRIMNSDIKLMGYSTFRHFLKKQFSNIKFAKLEKKDINNTKEVKCNSKKNAVIEPNFDVPKITDIQAMPIIMLEDNIEFAASQVPQQIFQDSIS